MSFIDGFLTRCKKDNDDSFALQTLRQLGSDFKLLGYEEDVQLTEPEEGEDEEEDYSPITGTEYAFLYTPMNLVFTVTVSDNDYGLSLLPYDAEFSEMFNSINNSSRIAHEANEMIAEYVVKLQEQHAVNAQETVDPIVNQSRKSNSI